MAIHKATFAHPKTGYQMTLHSAAAQPKFRSIVKDCIEAGYVLVSKTEYITDFRTSSEAVMVLEHFMPMDGTETKEEQYEVLTAKEQQKADNNG